MRAAGVVLAGLLGAEMAAAEVVVVQPGPEGEDTSPYAFLPLLPRGDRETMYAFSDLADVHDFETLVRFALPPDLLGPDEEVGEALLALYFALDSTSFGETSGEPGVLECREVLEPWTEMGVTWVARPALGAAVDVVTGLDALGPVFCDVTDLVAAWAAGAPNHGIGLTNPTARLLGFYSFEAPVDAALRPALFVEVVPAPEPGAGAAGLVAAAALAARARRVRAARGEA